MKRSTSNSQGRHLAVDNEIVEAVRRAGPDSPAHRDLRDALQHYGIGTLTNLDQAGRLFFEIERQTGITLAPRPVNYPADRRRIIVVAAIVAIDKFMERQVFAGGWLPQGGSSLRSYAVRACLYEFVNEYKQYVREERGSLSTPIESSFDESSDVLQKRSMDDPETAVVNRDTVQRALELAGSEVSRMVLLTSAGWTQQEIGQHLALSEEAVSSALRRFRRAAAAR